MHPILEEMARAKDVRPEALPRWISVLAAHIAALEAEVDRLKEAQTKKGRAA